MTKSVVAYEPLERDFGMASRVGHLVTGITCLIVYSCFLEQLWYYSTRSSEQLSVYAHVVYGLMANVGHFLGIFLNGHFPVEARIYSSCVMMSVAAIAFPAIASAKIRDKLLWSLVATGGLAVGNSLCASTAAGIAAVSAPVALNYLYMGQSISGLIPWPMMVVTNICLKYFGVDDMGIPSGIDELGSSIVILSCGAAVLLFIPFFKCFQLPMIKSSQSMLPATTHVADPCSVIFKRMLPLTVTVWFILMIDFIMYPREIIKWKLPVSEMSSMAGFLSHPATYTSTIIFLVILANVLGIWCGDNYFASVSDIACRWLVGARVCVVPLFWLASSHPSFDGIYFRVSISVLMGFSGGALFAMCLARLGRFVGGSHNMETGGHIITFTVVNGIAVGAIIGALVEALTVYTLRK